MIDDNYDDDDLDNGFNLYCKFNSRVQYQPHQLLCE